MEDNDFNEEFENSKASRIKQAASNYKNKKIEDFVYKKNQKDIDAINNRKGINEGTGKLNEEETINPSNNNLPQNNDLNNKNDGLEDKNKLNNKNNLENNKNDKSKEDNKNEDSKKKEGSIKDKAKGLIEDESAITKLKKKWLMLKLKIRIIIVVFSVLAILFLFLLITIAVLSSIDTFANTITNFFGISEADEDSDGNKMKGMYNDEQYWFDDDGNAYNSEELVNYLKNNYQCKPTFWTKIGDFFRGKNITDYCYLMRTIEKENNKRPGIDKSITITTLFYKFDSQPLETQYKEAEDIPEDMLSSAEHYKSLAKLLDEEGVNSGTITTIMDNAMSTTTNYYYKWEVETNPDGEGNSENIGKCEKHESKSSNYSLKKWQIFMRYGEEVAEKYDEFVNTYNSTTMTSEECLGGLSEEELLERVRKAGNFSGEVTASLASGEENPFTASDDIHRVINYTGDAFDQKADVDSKEKDEFESLTWLNEKVEFDYRNGYVYTSFPGYSSAINDDDTMVFYDDIFTTKEIETNIEEIINKKIYFNEILMYPDVDNPDYYYGANRSSSVVTGANCKQYLSANFEDIRVRLTDCYGSYLGETSFEDYIIGVANAEVSDSGDDYVLSEMVAAISYALARRNNYQKGNIIEMKSGTCDQAYCSLEKGCSVKSTPVGTCSSCTSFYIGGSKGKDMSRYAKYQALFAKAVNYLVVKDGKVQSTEYRSTTQNEWKRKANQGMSFTQIIQETYPQFDLIRCSDTVNNDSTSNGQGADIEAQKQEFMKNLTRIGNKKTSEYPKVSPDKGLYYGFAYKDKDDGTHIEINEEWKKENLVTISPNCSDEKFANMKFTVNKNAVDNFEVAFDGICKMITTGVKISDGNTCLYTMDHLLGGETFYERKTTQGDIDIHAYGLAQDWNYRAKFLLNGKYYKPYNERDLESYIEFINAIGGEEKCQNINFILYKYAYMDAGFEWGGNFGRKGNDGVFDGKLFTIKYK